MERYDTDLWTDEFAFLNQPGQADIQSDLFYDDRKNVDGYPMASLDAVEAAAIRGAWQGLIILWTVSIFPTYVNWHLRTLGRPWGALPGWVMLLE